MAKLKTLDDLNKNFERAARLDRRIQFRALSPGTGRNKTRKVSIPSDMIEILGWSSDKPIKVQINPTDLTVTMEQVDPSRYGLRRKQSGSEWEYGK